MSESILDVQNLSLTLDSKPILRDVSLSVRRNEIIALIGPNGAGKTSLLKSLLGLYRVDSGRASSDGADALHMSSEQRARLFSYVPQQEERSLGFSVSGFVEMGLYSAGLRFSWNRLSHAKVTDALKRVGMESFAQRTLRTLSGGESQKVFLAAALAQDAKIMLLDEPTSFLDPLHQTEVMHLLERIVHEDTAAHPSAVVFVTHEINLALAVADRIVALKDGAVVFVGKATELAQGESLQRIFDLSLRTKLDQETGKYFALGGVYGPRKDERK